MKNKEILFILDPPSYCRAQHSGTKGNLLFSESSSNPAVADTGQEHSHFSVLSVSRFEWKEDSRKGSFQAGCPNSPALRETVYSSFLDTVSCARLRDFCCGGGRAGGGGCEGGRGGGGGSDGDGRGGGGSGGESGDGGGKGGGGGRNGDGGGGEGGRCGGGGGGVDEGEQSLKEHPSSLNQ